MKSIHSTHSSRSFLIRSLFLCLILGTLTGFGQDSTGPTLVSVTPERNAKEVDPNSAVTFNFSVPMKRQHVSAPA